MDKSIKLDELIPMDSSVRLGDEFYGLRKIDLSDEVWIKNTFAEEADDIFVKQDFEAMSRIAFRLLVNKKDFQAVEVDDFDDCGFPIKRKISGTERIRSMISGPKEKVDFLWALYKTFGISRPEPSEDVEPKKE